MDLRRLGMEPDIAPLARALAEENNVDWRTLTGSGTGGRIIEMDVLEHLYRVMSGEAEVNPTAEPVPLGMEAWPEEDVAGYYRPSAPAESASEGVIEDDFLLDMDVESSRQVEPSVDLDTRFDGDFAVDLGGSSALEPFAQAPTEELADISEDLFLFDDFEEPPMREEAGFADLLAASEPEFEPALLGADAEDALDFTPALMSDAAKPAWGEAEPPEMVLFASGAQTPEGSSLVADELPLFADFPTSPNAEAEDVRAESLSLPQLGELKRDSLASESNFPAEMDEPSPAATFGEPEVAALGRAATVLPNQAPLVSYGVLLRRHVDLKQLIGAQTALAHELMAEAPLGLLLARAAAKALRQAPLGEDGGVGGVGLARLSDAGVRVSPLEGAASLPLSELLATLSDAEGTGGCGLAVADLSDYGVDEAVLNLGTPVLSLGRILYDSELGGHHSTLALSGEVGALQGSRFLAAVAELLSSPVRLVL